MKKSGSKSKIFGILVILCSIVLFIVLRQKDYTVEFDTEVEKWDNLYKGNNIHFYYIKNDLDEIVRLKNTYKIEEAITEGSSDLKITMELDNWLKNKCDVSLDIMDSNKNTEEILSTLLKNSTLSQKDYNRVMQELLAALNVRTRIGEYGTNETYHILEVWDKELNKWIAYDVMNGGYFKDENGPLSGVELVDKNIDTTTFVLFNGEEKTLGKKELEPLKQSLTIYTIKIDNSLYEGSLINSHVSYIKSEANIYLETEKGYIQPTIFTMDMEVFNRNPWEEYVDDESDEVPTIILAKRSMEADGDTYIKFTLGAFMNSLMVEKYYVRVNGGEFVEVNTYYDLTIEKGQNTIELSLDGVNPIRCVVINKK